MNQIKVIDFLAQNLSELKGVGPKITGLLKKKNIEKVSDLLWNFPQGATDRTNLKKLDELEVGKITTIKVKVIKYNFPRIRKLPNKVLCEDDAGKIDIVFFNSKEGYIRKILPINNYVIISGKINFFKKKYQITNPAYVVPLEREDYVKRIIPKYTLTDGITEKMYRNLIDQVIMKITDLKEWHSDKILKKIGNVSWSKSIIKIHKGENIKIDTRYIERIAYDEILANLLVLSHIRKKIKKIKKKNKIFVNNISNQLIKNLNFELTLNQRKIVDEINYDLKSEFKMFRLLQGDVGSGKTIVSFIAAANVIESKFQVALMAPTEILAKQHFDLALKVFRSSNVNINLLSGKLEEKNKKKIYEDLLNGKIDFLIGTHALFQKNVHFKKLGLIIIDEQHKFGVKQRINLSKKGGDNCDVLLMSATPIPRTLILSIYGDMDISKLIQKPKGRKNVITISKPEEKINEIIFFLEKEIKKGNQIFWICPLIEESDKLNYSAAIKKHDFLSKKFNKKVGLIHGSLKIEERNNVLKKFLDKSINILVSTTVIEIGVDFPNANIIVIENSDKFGLSQLHQLRGRVGRGENQGVCILLFKKNLSENAKKRLKILKSSNDGFYIAEKDMLLRGFGDILGYQQSGIKDFKIANVVKHQNLFKIAEENIKEIESNENNFHRYNFLLKLFDKVDIINQINSEIIN